MLIRKPTDIDPSEITPKAVFLNRRQFMATTAGGLLFAADAMGALTAIPGTALKGEKTNTFTEATTYNNFYEFGTSKSAPSALAGSLKTRPWSVAIDGEVEKPRTFTIEELLKLAPLEERIYRLRCVEGWSMVIPWIGYSLSALLKLVQPTSRGKFVYFETIYAPDQMRGQKYQVLDWPYREGLRIDEAMHPLTILGLGMYGDVLPNQNGAPVRIVVPWKYGFKSIKSIVRIRLVENQPLTSWSMAAPSEYGFYSNVNPEVDHPRWSQARERRIGEFSKRKTLMFNGYAEQVASMYAGMDLQKYY